jgi:flagellar protein FlaG
MGWASERADDKATEKNSEKTAFRTDKTERDRETQKEMVEKMVERLNRMSRVLDRKIQFELAEETEDVIVKIVDRETGHTIRQIPPPELVKLTTRMEEIHEMIFNLKL